MGLDMYLQGEAYFHKLTDEERLTKPIQHVFYLGRLPTNDELHTYIVSEFSGKEYDWREIPLDETHLRQVIAAIKTNYWPLAARKTAEVRKTSKAQKAEIVEILQRAIGWVSVEDGETWRSVYYQASW